MALTFSLVVIGFLCVRFRRYLPSDGINPGKCLPFPCVSARADCYHACHTAFVSIVIDSNLAAA